MRHHATSLAITAAVFAIAGTCGAAGLSRPADPAERLAAGFDDPGTIVLMQSHVAGATGARAPAGSFDYQTRIGTAFVGRTSAFAFSGNPPSTSCPSGNPEIFATASLDLPDGALIRYVDTFGYDVSESSNLRTFLISLCQGTYESAPPTYVVHGDVQTSGSPGDVVSIIDLDADPLPIERASCQYLVRARFSSSDQCVGGTIFLDKVRVGYTTP
jgi:hypothetical protein